MATKPARKPAARAFNAPKFDRLLKGAPDWAFSARILEKTGRRLNPATIGSYRRGRTVPSYDNAAAIAATLGVSMDELGE